MDIVIETLSFLDVRTPFKSISSALLCAVSVQAGFRWRLNDFNDIQHYERVIAFS